MTWNATLCANNGYFFHSFFSIHFNFDLAAQTVGLFKVLNNMTRIVWGVHTEEHLISDQSRHCDGNDALVLEFRGKFPAWRTQSH